MRPGAGVLIGLLWLGWASVVAAESDEQEAADRREGQRLTPYACEAWQDRIAGMAESDDPLTRELAEFYADEEHQWCQTRRRRVPEEREPWFDFDLSNADLMAEVARWLAISLLLILVLWAAWRWRRQLARWLPQRSNERHQYHQPVGEREPLGRNAPSQPVNPAEEARRLWHDGHSREALALLYRAMLQHYLDHQPSAGSLTEREALRELRQRELPAERLAWCRQLTQAWLNTAWGHRPLETPDFEALLDDWPRDAAGYQPEAARERPR